MRRHVLIGVCVLAAVLVGAAALASRGESRRSTFDKLSNEGKPVSIAGLLPIDRAELENASVVELRLLADREGVRFYRGLTRGGQGCVILARSVGGRERFGVFGCPTTFPSEQTPVADLTSFEQTLDEAYPVATEVAGFAADGIDAVGVRAPGGGVQWIPVAGNVYLGPPGGLRVSELLVRDQQGGVVQSTPVGGRTLREEYGVTG